MLRDKRIRGFSESALLELQDSTAASNVEESIVKITEAFFPHVLAEQKEPLERLLSIAGEYGSEVSSFLCSLQLGSPADTYIRTSEQVALMTMHAAKGLEFSYVFIIGCEDGIVPYTLFARTDPEIEEERRLLYVGMTRAKNALFLCYAKTRNLFGMNLSLPISPYVLDIKDELVKKEAAEKGKRKPGQGQLSLF